MRWLLLKDLQILRRSPLLTALLVIYPIVLAVLIGFAVSRDSDKPRVAFFNEIEADAGRRGPGARRGRLQPAAGLRPALRAGRVRRYRQPRRRDQEGGGRRGAGGARPARGLPRQAPEPARRRRPGPGRGRGLRERGRPGQGRAGGRPDQRPDHRGQPDPLRRDLRAAAQLPRRAGRGRGFQRPLPGPDDRGAGPGTHSADPARRQRRPQRAPARRRQAGDPVRGSGW